MSAVLHYASPRTALTSGLLEDQATSIEQALAYSFALVASVDAYVAAFDIPGVELPPSSGGAADQAALRVTAPLYLASELEAARLLPAAETLAGLFATGAITTDLGDAAPKLIQFWRNRNQRLTRGEREALFSRLFGSQGGAELAMEGANNDQFEDIMIELCDALHRLDPDRRLSGLPQSEGPLRAVANIFVSNLLPRTSSVAALAVQELLESTREALEILNAPPVQRLFGARSVWQVVETITRKYLRQSVAVVPHVVRAREGQVVLAWVAEAILLLDDRSRLIEQGAPVVNAARAWMEASLTLAEQ